MADFAQIRRGFAREGVETGSAAATPSLRAEVFEWAEEVKTIGEVTDILRNPARSVSKEAAAFARDTRSGTCFFILVPPGVRTGEKFSWNRPSVAISQPWCQRSDGLRHSLSCSLCPSWAWKSTSSKSLCLSGSRCFLGRHVGAWLCVWKRPQFLRVDTSFCPTVF